MIFDKIRRQLPLQSICVAPRGWISRSTEWWEESGAVWGHLAMEMPNQAGDSSFVGMLDRRFEWCGKTMRWWIYFLPNDNNAGNVLFSLDIYYRGDGVPVGSLSTGNQVTKATHSAIGDSCFCYIDWTVDYSTYDAGQILLFRLYRKTSLAGDTYNNSIFVRLIKFEILD